VLDCKRSRWDPSNSAVWSNLAVVLMPDGDGPARLGQGLEPVLVEALIPGFAVEALDVSVLFGLARLNQDVVDGSCLHPGHGGPAGELRSVVRPDGLWIVLEACNSRKDPGHVSAWHGQHTVMSTHSCLKASALVRHLTRLPSLKESLTKSKSLFD
jgi:hypothetical protein